MPTGYEGNERANRESFFVNGYFSTGDMGHLDQDGYLYITGRSKEVSSSSHPAAKRGFCGCWGHCAST